ncbi:uncharacterized protein LOC118732510, partial [Rhagoletis pomonella]|uniref:uncharacterized protein LOC118732510 n=1 Tax=Rhagoletis pomonella TaxID=28610 RepID=UPI001787762F
MTRKNFSPVHLIAELEQGIQTLEEDREKDTARCNIATSINAFKNQFKNNKKEKFILRIFEDTKRFIKQHKDSIVITNADKGNKTVMMDKTEYKEKMKDLLSDRYTYKTIRMDPTQKLLRKNNAIVNDIYKQKNIDNYQKHKLTCNAATEPRLYGLPNIHKVNTFPATDYQN